MKISVERNGFYYCANGKGEDICKASRLIASGGLAAFYICKCKKRHYDWFGLVDYAVISCLSRLEEKG